MSARPDEPAPTTQSVHRALQILEVLVAQAPRIALGQIAQQTGLSSATTYRLLQTLVTDGYATALEGGRYGPGTKILTLAGQVMTSMDYSLAARSALVGLQAHTPETIHFGVLAGDHAQYADKLESRRPYRLASVIGMTLPLHCTSIGKAILAHLSTADTLLESLPLTPRTPRTITEPQRLRAELGWVRDHGFAIDDEEDREGVRCIAAPVFDQFGEAMGAVGVSAPAMYLSFQDAMTLAPHVREAAAQVSGVLAAPKP